MNIPVGQSGLVVPLNAIAPGSVPLAAASAEGQKGHQPDFAALVAARPESIRMPTPAQPEVPASQTNVDTSSDGAEGEGRISDNEQTIGPQATADENRDQPLEKELSLTAHPLLPEALTKKTAPPARASSADPFNPRAPATSAKHEIGAEEPIKAETDTPDQDSRIDTAPVVQTLRQAPRHRTSQMAGPQEQLPGPGDTTAEAGAAQRSARDSPIAGGKTRITEFGNPDKNAGNKTDFGHMSHRSTAADGSAKLLQAEISDSAAALLPLSGPAVLSRSTEAPRPGSEMPADHNDQNGQNGQNGLTNETIKLESDAETFIPVAHTVAPKATDVPPVPTAPLDPDSAAIQRSTGPASPSGMREAPRDAMSALNGEGPMTPSASVPSNTLPKAQVAPNTVLQAEITPDPALQKLDTARPAAPARNEVTLPVETNTALQPESARAAPLPIEGVDKPPPRPALQAPASGPDLSLSARTEIAGTAARFSAFPAPDSPATPRVEIGGSALGQAVQVPFHTTSKSAEILPAIPASGPVEMSYSEAPKRSAPDLLPPTQTSVSLAGPVSPIPMGIQPQPLAGGFPVTRAVEAEFKSETVSSLLMPSDTPELSSWDASRIAPTPTGAAAPLRSELAAHVARQLVDVMGQAGNRPVEITLSPEELGRVRMGITTEDGRIIVNILAERPDTLDLMRRHIDQLGQTFRSMGYDQVAFSFGRGAEGGDQSGSAPPDGQASPSTGNAGLEGDLPSDAPTIINLDPTATRGVDIRL